MVCHSGLGVLFTFTSVVVGFCSRASSKAAYEAFRHKYGRALLGDKEMSYAERNQIFEKTRAAVEKHNAQPGVSWRATVNQFADYSPEEFHAQMGYVSSSNRLAPTGSSSSFLETRAARVLSESRDWSESKQATNSASFFRDQGSCGSCWAVAAVGALEMHAEISSGQTHKLSFEQLVDCTPNPQHCGGTGGCAGATAELAFQYVKENGLVGADEYQDGYLSTGHSGKCKAPTRKQSTSIDGFSTLPVNKLRPLMEVLSDKGPVVVSVAASGWQSYDSGVFNSCSKNAVVNHAVVMVGYGKEKASGMNYFRIRNSWGQEWGENGHIRIQRFNSDEGDAGHCGIDGDPKAGVGCDKGPTSLPVCGMCGVLSDSSYPKGVRVANITK